MVVVLSLMIPTITAFTIYLLTQRQGQKQFQANLSRTMQAESASVQARLSVVETKIDLFWRGLAADAAAILHKPHPEFARRDTLLELFLSGEISLLELDELRNMLLEVIRTERLRNPDSGERLAASIIVRMIEAFGDHEVASTSRSDEVQTSESAQVEQ